MLNNHNHLKTMKNILLLLSIAALLASCATRTKVEYVDREVVKYETKVQHDTIVNNVHDSIYHTIMAKGDTVYDTKYIERTRWKERVVYRFDTIYSDVVITKDVEKIVEKKVVPKWCYLALGVAGVLLISFIVSIYLWLKR